MALYEYKGKSIDSQLSVPGRLPCPAFRRPPPALKEEARLIYRNILGAVFGSPGFLPPSSCPPRLTQVSKNSLHLILGSLVMVQQALLGASPHAQADVPTLSLRLLCWGAEGLSGGLRGALICRGMFVNQAAIRLGDN